MNICKTIETFKLITIHKTTRLHLIMSFHYGCGYVLIHLVLSSVDSFYSKHL